MQLPPFLLLNYFEVQYTSDLSMSLEELETRLWQGGRRTSWMEEIIRVNVIESDICVKLSLVCDVN